MEATTSDRRLPIAGLVRLLVSGLALILLLAACEGTADRIAGHVARGTAFVQAGEDEKARLEFANVLRLDPENAVAHRALAGIHERLGNGSAFAGHLAKLAELTPADPWVLVRLARLAYLAGDAETAARRAEAAVLAAPADPDALATRAALALARGERDRALADVEAALAVAPGNPLAGAVLVRELAGRGANAEALAKLDAFLAGDPGNLDLNRLRLGILAALNDRPGIGAQLDRLLTLRPYDPAIWEALIVWHAETGDLAGGFARLRERIARPDADAFRARWMASLAGRLVAEAARVAGPDRARAELEALAASAADPFPFRLMLAELDFATDAPEAAKARLLDLVATEGRPENAHAARLALARLAVAAGDRAAAAREIDVVLAADSGHAEALALRAALHLAAGAAEAANADILAALAQNPRDPRLLTLAAEASRQLGKPALASQNLAAAMQATGYGVPETLRYAEFLVATDQRAAAEIVLAEAARRQPDAAAILERLGALRIELGRWSEIEAVAAALDDLGAPGIPAERLRAAALAGQGKDAEALAILEPLARNPAQRAGVLGPIVATRMRMGDPAGAEAVVDGILAEAPAEPVALYLKAWLREQAGDAAAAATLYRTLADTDPARPGGWRLLAEFHMRKGDDATAAAVLAEGLAARPGAVELLLSRAGMEERQGAIDAAIATYEEVLAAAPDMIVAANNVVSLITDHRADDPARLGRAREIASVLRGATTPELQDTYGWVLHLNGDHAGAVESLEPAAQKLPGNPWVRYHLGMAQAKLGRTAEARVNLAAALDLSRDRPFPPADTIRAVLATLGQ